MDFSEILKHEISHVRIPRDAFAEFSNLSSLTFKKVEIETWNYKKILFSIFKKKLETAKTEQEKKTIGLIHSDILCTLASSFKLSKEIRPYEVQLELVSDTPCPKVHSDYVPLRIVCTYQGPGTLFYPDKKTEHQTNPFEILLMKGRKFNLDEANACDHRSPILKCGEERLILKIDFK